VRNQDDEHNLRIVAGGGRVWQSARIVSTYRPRARLGAVFRQYLQYGYWKPFVMKKHGQAAALRQVVPALFVSALAAGAGLAASRVTAWPITVLGAVYALVVVAMTAAIARSSRPRLAAFWRVPLVIVASHVAYGLGSIAGWIDVVRGAHGRARFSTLTR
jgi:hypothetical protein